jgi:hypothetical protein
MARFKLRPGAIPAIARSAGVGEAIASKVDAVCQQAKANAGQVRRSGHYAESITTEVKLLKATGWEGRVRAMDFKAAWIEFGTGHPQPTAKYRVLGRALDSVRES